MGLLAETLRFAVPMWQIEMRHAPRDRLKLLASECAQTVAECGDTLMFKSRNRTAATFNAFAKGLACICILQPNFDFAAWCDKFAEHEDEFQGD